LSKTINISLEGGFDTQSEPSLVGVGLTKMDNLHNMQTGALKQRDGYGTPVEIGGGSNDKLILDIEYWLKDTTLWWLAYDRTLGQINRLTSDFATATNLNTMHQISATQTVGTGNALVVEAHEWTGTEPTKYYFKITSDASPDVFQISLDDTTYTDAQNVVTSSTAVTGASGLKAYWGSLTSSALNDKWEVTVYPFPKRIGISNWGNAVRFAYGLYHNPSLYTYIDRKYFNNGTDFFYSYNNYYYDEKSYPREPQTFTYSPTNAQGINGEVTAGGSLTINTDYYYKIIPVFDGSQISQFEAVKFGPLTTSSGNLSCKINLTLDTSNYNPRITGCRIYRASTSSAIPNNGSYRLIKTINFTASQISWINTTSAYKGRKLFAHSLTYDYSSWGSTSYWSTTEFPTSSAPSNTFTKVGTKFLWSSADVDDDKWNETLSSPKYVFTGNTQLLTNNQFTGNMSGWTIVDTTNVSYGTNNVDCDETGTINNWTLASGPVAFYQDIDVPVGTESLKLTYDFDEGLGTYSSGWVLTTTGDVNISVSAVRGQAGTYNETLSCSGNSGTLRLNYKYMSNRDNGSANSEVDNVYVFALRTTITSGYTHQSMFAIENSGIADGTAVGKIAKIGGQDYSVVENQGDIFKVSGNAGWTSGNSSSGNAINGAEVSWLRTAEDGTLSATQTKMVFTDVGEISGGYHPFSGTTSLDTKFKYSTSVGGRQYVGNVIISDEQGVSETYDDMVLFSEINQPDVIPISNFIKLNDQQGGAITGIRGLFSDIVVFAERGIFRISVPNEDPTSWSMVEAEKNLGCNQPNSICEYRGGLFFAGLDSIWYISPNFQFIPISNNFKDVYQGLLTSTTETNDTQIRVDIENDRLVCKVGANKDDLYVMDLKAFENKKILWYKNTPSDQNANEGEIQSFSIKNDNTFYLLNKVDDEDSTKIRPMSGGYGNNKPLIKTGLIFFRSLTDKSTSFIRRINFNIMGGHITDRVFRVRCRIDHSSEEEGYLGTENVVDKTLTTTEDSSTGRDNYHSLRIGQRAKSIQLEFEETTVHLHENTNPLIIREIEIEID
tara:strand:- start:16471 stop:19653 length:3183 start_codon:yes stop_codon:yes gene_type:complete